MNKNIYAVILGLAISGLARAATTNYVATTGVDNTDPGRGKSWNLPYLTISNAVANATNVNDLVLVSNGTYLLTAQITVSSQIVVRSWNNGVIDSTNTIANGNASTRCFYITHTGAVVEGFTIYNGQTNADGGGVYMGAGTLRNCIVVSNSIPVFKGGGIYVGGTLVDTVVDNCTIAYNIATNGGGCYVYNGLVTNCEIRDNQALVTSGADMGGGGVKIRSSSVLANSRVHRNASTNHGGGILREGGGIVNCVISNNFAINDGGGVRIVSSGLLTNCTVINNVANGVGAGVSLVYGGIAANSRIIGNCATSTAAKGGGVSMLGNIPRVLNSEIRDNRSKDSVAGVYMTFQGGSAGYMNNCLIIGNISTSSYGGVYVQNGPATIENCTIVSNQSLTGSSYGGLYMSSYDADGYKNYMANCIVYYNLAATAGNSNYAYSGIGNSFSNCCFAPALTGSATNNSTNNITADPQFTDKDSGNWRLKKESPCINTGVNRDWMSGAVDLDGHSRIDRFSGIVDIGCYEHVPAGTIYRFH